MKALWAEAKKSYFILALQHFLPVDLSSLAYWHSWENTDLHFKKILTQVFLLCEFDKGTYPCCLQFVCFYDMYGNSLILLRNQNEDEICHIKVLRYKTFPKTKIAKLPNWGIILVLTCRKGKGRVVYCKFNIDISCCLTSGNPNSLSHNSGSKLIQKIHHSLKSQFLFIETRIWNRFFLSKLIA